MFLSLAPPTTQVQLPTMCANTMGGDYQEASVSLSADITTTNSLALSWPYETVVMTTEISPMAYGNTTVHQPPSTRANPCVCTNDIATSSQTFKFNGYSQMEGLEVGKYLVSDTFSAGGYDWAITLYPNGKKGQYKDYISLYIRLESEKSDVKALFELMLVDQSGKGEHRIQTHFGRLQEKQPFLMRRRGSLWGSGRCMENFLLKKSGYLKDDCLVVSCVVGVLAIHTKKENLAPSDFVPYRSTSSVDDQGMKESNCEVPTLPCLRSAKKIINRFSRLSSIASFQKLFAVLDLYKALFVILPEIQNVFHSAVSANIYNGASKTMDNLATLVRKLFSSFEETVLNERLNTSTRDGSIHSLTEYAMNYVTSISQYKELLMSIILSSPTNSLEYQSNDQFLNASGRSPLQLHMIWIMISLRINLEGKSRCHEYSTLRYVFMMNNVNYIIKTITGSPELLELIGKEYVSQLSKDVMQAAQDYFSSIWHEILFCLRDDGIKYKFPFYNKISGDSLKDRFKAFNTKFEEVCQTLSFVLDIQLRNQLHELILSQLIPAYKSFLEKYSSHTLREKYKERYIKYSSEDLEYAFGTLAIHNGVAVDSGIN